MLRQAAGFGEGDSREAVVLQADSWGIKAGLERKDSPLVKRESLCGGGELGSKFAAATAATKRAHIGHAGIGGYGHTLAAEIYRRPLVSEAEQVGQGGDDSGETGVHFEVGGVADNSGYTAGKVSEHGVGDFVDAAA